MSSFVVQIRFITKKTVFLKTFLKISIIILIMLSHHYDNKLQLIKTIKYDYYKGKRHPDAKSKC